MDDPNSWYFHEIESIIYVLEQIISQYHLWIERYCMYKSNEKSHLQIYALNHPTFHWNIFVTTSPNDIKLESLESRMQDFSTETRTQNRSSKGPQNKCSNTGPKIEKNRSRRYCIIVESRNLGMGTWPVPTMRLAHAGDEPT